jgi:hypothetical protein
MLTQQQVTALTAQAARAATYTSRDDAGNLLADWQLNDSEIPVYTGSEISTRGVGIYGQTPEGLILTGYLKPATLNLIVSPAMTAQVLNTPAVWTGQFGIESLLDYLNSDILQNISQLALLAGSYQGFVDAGYLSEVESARYQATLLQPAAQYGVTAVIDWIEGRTSTELTTKIDITARQGQYAIDFADTYAAQLNPGIDLPGFSNTVQREELDFALTEIIGNPKIPIIEYADIVSTLVSATNAANIATPTTEDGIFRFAPGAQRS